MYDAVRWKVTQFQRLGGVSSSSRRMDQFKSRGMCLFGWDFQSVCWQISPLKIWSSKKKPGKSSESPNLLTYLAGNQALPTSNPSLDFLWLKKGSIFLKKMLLQGIDKITQIYKKIHPKSSNFRAVVPWNIVLLVAGNKSPRRFSGSA